MSCIANPICDVIIGNVKEVHHDLWGYRELDRDASHLCIDVTNCYAIYLCCHPADNNDIKHLHYSSTNLVVSFTVMAYPDIF